MTITLSHRRRSHRKRFASITATTLSFAFVLALLVPNSAVAAPPEEDIADIPVPSSEEVEWVWRADTRHPTEWGVDSDGFPQPPIFEDGFRPLGQPGSWNENLMDHVINTDRGNSAWVSTTYDQYEAQSFGKVNLEEHGSFWEYQIAPDADFHSVQSSVKDKLLGGGDYDEALADRWDTANPNWFEDVRGEAEMASHGPIANSQVHSARQWTRGDDGEWTVGESTLSDDFVQPDSVPTLEPYDIPDTGICYPRRAACAPSPGSEDELADLHGDRFTGQPEDFDFSLRPGELAAEESALLAPAPDTIDVVADFAGEVKDPASFAEFTEEIGGSFAADVDALAEVTSHLEVITSLGEAMDLGLDSASELIPYLGIAATGYAMKEDISHGAWGDLAADSIAEGIQTLMIVAPEFDWILAPALWADLIAKAIGDWVYGLAHPAPNYTTEYRDNLAKAHDQVDAAPTVLTDSWTAERNTVLSEFYAEHMGERLGTTLAAKITSDAAVLKELDRAVGREIARHELVALRSANTDAERMQVRRSALTAESVLHDTTRAAIAERVQQYRDRYPGVIDATAAETWALDLSDLAENGFLDNEKVDDYTVKVSEIAWEASYQKTWDKFESWELETAEPRRDAEAQALRAVVVNTERAAIRPEALSHKHTLVKQLTAQVDKAIEESIAVPANVTGTTLGVHDLEIATEDEGTWSTGSTGTVRWDRQSVTGSSGVDAEPGTQMTWTLQLPKGLDVVALPEDESSQYWSQTWKHEGRVITHTVERRSGSVTGAFNDRQRFEVPVRATADVAARELVEVRFRAPSGYRSLASAQSLRMGGSDPLRAVSFPAVELHPTDPTPVRFGIEAVDRAVTALRGELTLTAPEGTKFIPQTSVDVAYRTSADGNWKVSTGLPTSAEVGADGSSMVLRPASKGSYDLRPGYQSSWLPKLTVSDDSVTGVRNLIVNASLTTNLGTATLSIDTPVSTERRSTLSPLPMDQVTLTGWDAWQRVRFAGVETNQELSANGEVVVQRPKGLVFSKDAKVFLEGRSSSAATWTKLQEATDVRWETNAVRIGFFGSWDKGMQLAWSVEVRSDDFGGPTTVTVPTSVTAKQDDGVTSGSTSVTTATPPTVGVAVPGEYAAEHGTTSYFEVPFHNASNVRATGLRATIESVGESTMWFIAKWRAEGQSDWTMLDTTLEKGVLHIDDQSVPTIAPGGKATLVFSMMPLGPLDSAQPGGVLRITGGGMVAPGAEHRFDLRLSKTPPVDPPEAAAPVVTVRQSVVPELRSGQTGDVVYELRNDGNAATSTGTIVDLTPPTSAKFANRQVQYRIGDGAWKTVDAYLSWPAPALRFALPEFAIPAKSTAEIRIAVTSTAPAAAGGTFAGVFTSPNNDAVPAQTHPMVFRAVASDPSRVLVQCWAGDDLLAEAQVKWAKGNGRYTATVERFRIDSPGATGRLGVMVRQGGGFEGPWATRGGLPLDGQWHDLDLTATAYDQDLGRIDGLLEVVTVDELGFRMAMCQEWFAMPS